MAFFQNEEHLHQMTHKVFNMVFTDTDTVPVSGIYRCLGCSREIAATRGDPFPPAKHHPHGPPQGPIRWQMIVIADHEPK